MKWIASASLVAAVVAVAAPASADGFGAVGSHLPALSASKLGTSQNPADPASVDGFDGIEGGRLPVLSTPTAGALPSLAGFDGVVSASPRSRVAARRRP
jgi:hypothetical protein